MSQKTVTFCGKPLRVVEHQGQSWCVVVDLCKILGLCVPENAKRVAEKLEPGEKTIVTVLDSMGRDQRAYAANEQGVMKMICMCRNGQAKEFKRCIREHIYPVRESKADDERRFEMLVSIAGQALHMAREMMGRDAV